MLRRLALVCLATVLCAAAGARAAPPAVDLFAPLRSQATPPPAPEPAEPSRVIYPDQRLPLRFSHARHLRQTGVDCATCHAAALTSTSARDSLLPAEAVCAVCHPIDRADPWKAPSERTGAPAACAACHPGLPKNAPEGGVFSLDELTERVPRLEIPPPQLKFNHQIHAARQIPCARCHGDLTKVDLATRAQLPRMSTCLSCHTAGLHEARSGALPGEKPRFASARCATCHLAGADGTLQVDLPSGRLVPSGSLRGDTHGATFAQSHGTVARNALDYCASCHRQSVCQRCHNGVVKPMDFHGGDYVTRHPIDARRNQPDCGSCHRRQTFCLGCHERLGVTSHDTLPGSPSPSAFFPASPRRFHPEGWAATIPGPGHHSFEAQRNLRSCTSCHREETCLACHSALPGGRMPAGVSPHPRDWVDSGRCQALASRNGRVCLKCHRSGSAELGCAN